MELRQYFTVLWRWLWLIVLGTFLAGSTAGAFSLSKPRVYMAKVGVVIIKSGYSFAFEPKIKTLSDEQLSSYQQYLSYNARRTALVAMVENGAIAAKVIETLGSELSPEEQDVGALLGMVQGESGGEATGASREQQGDLIEITVWSDDPKKATLIANAWAEAYEEYVNELYGGDVPGSKDTIQEATASAKADYESAEAALIRFVADNQIDELNRLVQEKQQIITSLQSGKQTAVTTLIDTELEARAKIIAEYINTQANNLLVAFRKEQQGKSAMLTAYMDAELNNRLTAIQEDQEARSKLFAQYVGAETNNRLAAFQKDQEARARLFAQYVEAEVNNRLLPFEKDQTARSKLFAQYVETEINNRLLAFQKDQEARAKLFAQYVEAEINNRLTAFQKEQEAKSALFNAYVNADIRAQTTVFNKQVDAKIQALTNSYAAKLKLGQLLQDAQALKEQIGQGQATDSSATSGLAILLLKAEAFASSAGLPGDLQLQLDTTGLAASPEEQVRDLEALISVLEDRVEELEEVIEAQSRELFNNEGYQFLATSRPEDDPLTKAIHQKYEELFGVGELAKAAATVPPESELSQAIAAKYEELFGIGELAKAAEAVWSDNELSQAIMAKYEELFEVGKLAKAADSIPLESELSQAIMARYDELFRVGELAKAADTAPLSSDLSEAIMARYEELFGVGDLAKAAESTPFTTPLFASIQAKYPDLFEIGDLTELTESVSSNNPLAMVSAEKSQELLQLKDLEALPAYTAAAEPLTRAIDELEKEVNQLQARLQQENATKQELTRARDLAWETYSTLARKVEEVSIASAVTGTEVRVAIPAVEPRFPVSRKTLQNTVLAGMVGLMLAVGVAFLIEYLRMDPSTVSEGLQRSE